MTQNFKFFLFCWTLPQFVSQTPKIKNNISILNSLWLCSDVVIKFMNSTYLLTYISLVNCCLVPRLVKHLPFWWSSSASNWQFVLSLHFQWPGPPSDRSNNPLMTCTMWCVQKKGDLWSTSYWVLHPKHLDQTKHMWDHF